MCGYSASESNHGFFLGAGWHPGRLVPRHRKGDTGGKGGQCGESSSPNELCRILRAGRRLAACESTFWLLFV